MVKTVPTVKAFPIIKLFGEHFVTVNVVKLNISGNNHYTVFIRINNYKAIPYYNNAGLSYAFKTCKEANAFAQELKDINLAYLLLSVIKAKNQVSSDRQNITDINFYKWFQYELMYELDLIKTIEWPITPSKTRIKIQAHPKFRTCKLGSIDYNLEFSVHGSSQFRSIDCSISAEYLQDVLDLNLPIANLVHSIDTDTMREIFKQNILSLDALGPSISKNLINKKSGMLRIQEYLRDCN